MAEKNTKGIRSIKEDSDFVSERDASGRSASGIRRYSEKMHVNGRNTASSSASAVSSKKSIGGAASGTGSFGKKSSGAAASGSSARTAGGNSSSRAAGSSSATKPPSKAASGSSETRTSSANQTSRSSTGSRTTPKSAGSEKQVSSGKQSRQKNANTKTATLKNRKEIRRSKYSASRKAFFIILFLIVLFLATGVAGYAGYTYLVDKSAYPVIAEEIELDRATTQKFKIEKGSTTQVITESLFEKGLIQNKFIFKLLSKFNGYDGEYKSGVHYLSEGLTYDEVMTILCGDPLTVTVTFPEGFTTVQIAERLEAKNVCKKDDFLKAVNSLDASSYPFLPSEKGNRDYYLDGYLFPDTYQFEIDSNVDSVIYKLLNRFNDIFLPDYYERAERLGLTVDQVLILASFVEKEAKVPSERELIARVYYNRMQSEELKLMQCDATVMYFLKRSDPDYSGSITKEQLAVEDPYNTYLYEGLTPGPICSPSEASIYSVITMNPHNYYYYVLKNDGSNTHVFSETFEQHQAAVQEMRGSLS